MKNKLNVLHLTFDMRIGGTEQVIKNLVSSVNKEKFNVSILCIEEPIGPFGEQLIGTGIKVDSFQRKIGFDFALIFKIRKYIKQHKIDILHCHQYSPWVYGVFASFLSNTKIIFTEHGRFYPDSGSWKRQLVNPFLVFCTSSITSISKATKRALVEFEYLNPKKIYVVYNGIALMQSNPEMVSRLRLEYNISQNDIVFGTVARLDPIKNQTLLIHAFEQVHRTNQNCKLLIVGDGDERDKLEQLSVELNIAKSVTFIGYIAKPADYMDLMDIFLLPSLSEGTSMTLLEAMSLRKPCVVTNAGGNSEVILHNHNGVVTPNGELQPFIEGMLQLVNNNDLRNKFGENSYNRFMNIFLNQTMGNSYMDIYSKISGK